jgi:hypothetical protein
MGFFQKILGADGTSILAVDADRKALRAALEPNQALGQYFVGDPSGLWATPAANAEGFQFRNSTTTLAIIERIIVQGAVAASVTAVQEFQFRIDPVSGWTGQGTGGTALIPQKRKSTMTASAMVSGDIRMITTTAAGLSAGTKTIGTDAAIYPGSLIGLSAATPLRRCRSGPRRGERQRRPSADDPRSERGLHHPQYDRVGDGHLPAQRPCRMARGRVLSIR